MKVKELFSDISKWTQLVAARDSKGRCCNPTGCEAVCYCLDGAIAKCYIHDASSHEQVIQLVRDKIPMKQIHPHFRISHWNDEPTTTFADVKRLVEELDI
jgi:hypothetical protein